MPRSMERASASFPNGTTGWVTQTVNTNSQDGLAPEAPKMQLEKIERLTHSPIAYAAKYSPAVRILYNVSAADSDFETASLQNSLFRLRRALPWNNIDSQNREMYIQLHETRCRLRTPTRARKCVRVRIHCWFSTSNTLHSFRNKRSSVQIKFVILTDK